MKKIMKNLLMMALAVFVGQAFAADPVATWTDFSDSTLTSGDYTLTKDAACTVNPDGSITLGGAGLTVTLNSEQEIYVTNMLTIAMDISGVSNIGTLTQFLSGGEPIDLYYDGENLKQRYPKEGYFNNDYGAKAWTPARTTIVLSYGANQNVNMAGTTTYVGGTDEANKINADGLKFTSKPGAVRNITQIKFPADTGMTIHSLRLYSSKLTDQEVNEEMNSRFTYVGGLNADNVVTIGNAINVKSEKTVRTIGFLNFTNGVNAVKAGGTLEVVSGETTFNTFKNGLAGTLKVNPDATFKNGTADGPVYGAVTLDIAGTLEITDGVRWSLGSDSQTILRDGAVLKGDGANDGHKIAYDYFNGATIKVEGDATIEGNIGSHIENTKVIAFEIAEGKTLTMSGAIKSSLLVSSGTFEITANQKSTGIGNITVNSGVLRINTESDRSDPQMAVPERKVITVNEAGVLELMQGYAYLSAEGSGLTKVVGNFYLGITGNNGLNNIRTKLEIESGKTLFVRNWRSNYALNPAELRIDGTLKAEGYNNQFIKDFSVNTSNLSGSGIIEVPVTLADGATLAGAVTVTGNVTVEGSVTVLGDADATVLTCNNAADIATNLTAPESLMCVVDGNTIKLAKKPVAQIGDTTYTNFADALAAAKAMTGDVTVEIYEKVTLDGPISGNFSSISFVGKDTDAEIYLDIQGAIYASDKTVSFADISLSKSQGGYVADAGFRNLAFGIFAAKEVNYTNCNFINGAYASSGKAKFTNCTFHPSHDRYGLWVYGDVECVVDGCTFDATRGIKLYAEGLFKTNILTVKNTDFSVINGKPAIVLCCAESVTLEGNTYSSTGVFELDLDGVPNGTTVTSDVPPTCINDHGACGVLVDGKIYTTVAQAKEVATASSTVTLLHNSTETVELPLGVELNKNGFEAAGITVAQPIAKIGEQTYTTLEAAFAAATEGQEIDLLQDATPALTSQRAITKAAVIDLNGKTLTLTEDDLYFGTTTFKNGTIVVDPSVKPSTAVFWMFANQTLTFDNVKIVATGVTGTYLIGLEGTNSNLNLLNGSEIIIDNDSTTGLTAVICDNGTDNNVVISQSTINVKNIEGRFYLGGSKGNIEVSDSTVVLNGVKEGFYLRAGQSLDIAGNSEVNIVLNSTEGRHGINVTDITATYTKAESATVNATLYKAPFKVSTYEELIAALAEDNAYVVLANDITATATQSSGYGKAGIVVDAGDVLDGNGKTLTINGANATWDCVIAMKGGEVKNLTIAGAMRGVFMPGANGDVVIDNCKFQNVIYTFNSDAGSKDYTVTIKNTELNGWTSFSDVHKSVTFENCSFAKGNGYAYCRPYQATTFNNCSFSGDFAIDCSQANDNKLAFDNCTYNGQAITSENAFGLFGDGSKVLVNGASADYTRVAQVGGQIYSDLQEAIKAAAPAGTVELLKDVVVDEWKMFSQNLTVSDNSLITLNINGMTINGNGNTLTVNSISSPEREKPLFYDAENLTVSNLTITVNAKTPYDGGIGLKSGTIDNVTFNGGRYAVLPGTGDVTVKGCTFNDVTGYAVYFEGDRDNLVITGNTFNCADGAYVVTLRGAATFTDNTVNTGKVNLANSAKGEVSGNNFGTERFKVYNGATAQITNNTINNLVFSDTNVPQNSKFTDNTLSAEALAALNAMNFVAQVGTTYYTSIAAAIAAAKDGETVKVFAGTYAVPAMKAGITIEGAVNADGTPAVLFEGTLSGTLEDLTMKNIHIRGGHAQRWAYAKGDLTFENVTFEATSVYALHFDGIAAGTNLEYKNCTIIGWAAMGGSPASCVFEDCTIKDNGRYGLIRTYFDTEIKNCTFDVANANTTDAYEDGIHAVEGAEITVTGCTNVNGDMKDLVNVHAKSVVTLDGVAIKNVAKIGSTYYTTLAEALAAAGSGDVVIDLLDNSTLDITAWETLAIGGDNTTTITINGNDKTLTFNKLNSDWNHIVTKNDAKLILNNMTITDSGNNNGPWNRYDINFGCDVELNNVTATKALAFKADATLNNVTINETTDAYAIWIQSNGQNVAINGLTVNSTGRGIKIDEQYVDNASKVALSVNGATFTTAKKAAIVVKSSAGADIALENVNIANVVADKTNAVWNDEDSAAVYGKIAVTGGTLAQEGVENFVATVGMNDQISAYYSDLHAAMVAAKAGETVKLIANVDLAGTTWEPVSFKGVFDGQNKTISNLTINKPGVSNTGFITSLNGSFKNVTFTNPTVTGGENTGVVAGRAGGSAALAENITLNGTIKVETTHSGYARAGGIVGGWGYGNYKNITVDGGDASVSYIKHTGGGDGRYVAGIVGHADDVDSYENCVVKNITISGGWLCGGIAGPGPADGLATGCAVENIKMNADYSGGMFGWYFGNGTIEDSSIKKLGG